MSFIHVGCGGVIDVKERQCLKCKHKWGRLTFLTTPNEIRQVTDSRAVKAAALRKKTYQPAKHLGGLGKVPGVSIIASLLPNWPRWARILLVVVVVVVVVVAYFIWWR